MEKIEELGRLPDSVYKHCGYDQRCYPEPTAENMKLLVDKIDELVRIVNELSVDKYNRDVGTSTKVF